MVIGYNGVVNDRYALSGFLSLFIRNLLSLMMVNIVFLICCIPVITIPASIVAMNRTVWMLADDENEGVLKRFFKTFKAELLRSIPLALILAVCQGGALFGTWFYFNTNNSNFVLLIPGFICLFLVVLIYLVQMYAFAMMAVADITLFKVLKNSFLLIFMYPGRTFGWGVLSLAVFTAGLWFFPHTLPILGLILFGLVCFINVLCVAKSINKHILV